MVKKGNLYFLVKSLSAAEQRYFRKYAGRTKSEANYLRLFNFIAKQNEYNDDEIRKHFKGEKFLDQLHVAKIYLTDLILKSLRNYHVSNSVYSDILDILRDVEILFEKELFDLCRLKLAKAEQLASKYEKEALLTEILSWKRRLLLVLSKADGAEMAEVQRLEQESIDRQREINYYWQQTQAILDSYTDKNLLSNLHYGEPSSLRSKTLLQHLRYSYHFLNGRISEAEKAVSDLIDAMYRHPERISDDPSPYATAISNKISILIGQKRWEEIGMLISKMREVPERFQLKNENKFTLRLWLRSYNLELEAYRDTNQLDTAITLINEIKAFFEKRNSSIPDNYRIMLYYQFASIYFSKGNFHKALEWTNHIINFNFGDVRDELQCYARILNLMIHFELKNIIVLRYAVDSTRRFFKKKKFTGEFAQGSLKLFSQLSLAYPDKYGEIFSRSFSKLFKDDSSPGNSNLDYLDLRGWLSAKKEETLARK